MAQIERARARSPTLEPEFSHSPKRRKLRSSDSDPPTSKGSSGTEVLSVTAKDVLLSRPLSGIGQLHFTYGPNGGMSVVRGASNKILRQSAWQDIGKPL